MPNNLKGYDFPQVIRSVFDIDKNCLRVCVVDGTTGPGGGFEVIIDHTNDSIRLGDGTNFLTSSTVLGKIGLDVNVINDIDIRQLDASLDNVAINDSVTGLSTEVNASRELQTRDDDANVSLTSIDAKMVDGNDIGDVTINNASGVNSVNIQDGGNSITVDAVDLDIRDINASTDNIAISDGTTAASVTLNNELNVRDNDANDSLDIIEANAIPVSTAPYAVVSVTNTATALRVGVANMVGRRFITIQAKGGTVWVGTDNTVTSGNGGTGFKLSSNSSVTLDYDPTITVYAIKSGGGSTNVFVSEES